MGELSFRDYPQKARRVNPEKVLTGATLGSQMPLGVGRVRQSLEQPIGNEPEDFGLNDTDERVTHQRNETMVVKKKYGKYHKVNHLDK